MLQLQANASNDARLSAHLAEASSRVSAVGRAYERLTYDANVETIVLSAYIYETFLLTRFACIHIAHSISTLLQGYMSMQIAPFPWL